MDELPPLEHRDDPFKLLGVPTDVDERELKRAYARKIKVYRPDRAPEEFALIHAAFEHVKMLQRAQQWTRVVAEPAPAEVAVPSTAAESVRHQEMATARAFVDAVARNDRAAAEEGWKALRANQIPLEEFIVDAPPPIQAWIFENVLLTWRELSQWRDPQAAFNVWMTAFSRCIRTKERVGWAIQMAGEPALLSDAKHDPMPAILILNAVSCLAWRDDDAARSILRAASSMVHHPLVSRLHDRATLDVDLVGREYRIHGAPPLPQHVRELLSDWSILAPPARHELVENLRTSLRASSGEYLEHFTATAKRHRRFSNALTERLLDGVPERRRLLVRLPLALRDKLGDELRAASRKTPWFLSLLVVLLGVATTVAVVFAMLPQLKKDDDYVMVPMFIMGAYLGAAMLLDRYLYGATVRRLLAVAIANAGVTRAAAREWLQANRCRALRLARFAMWMQADDALRLVGMIAGTVADDRELAEH
jgi:hypothetical protein